jgi:hypothetical protein
MTGFGPVPYELKIIGLPVEPLEGGTRCSLQTQPLFNRIESPGEKLEFCTFANVFHAVAGLVPAHESFPFTISMK